jgi:ATP-dependent protease HslVU (ClpYQ) peptidase subunit
MTVIVYRDGVMAADTRAWSGDSVPVGWKKKIRRLEDGRLVGCSCPEVGVPNAFLDWIAAGAPEDAKPKIDDNEGLSGLVVDAQGQGWLYTANMQCSGPIHAPYFAIGSGEKYALGALAMGATAEEAVQAACDLDVFSDLPLHTERH